MVARRSDGDGGMEAHGAELKADPVDEATDGAIFLELRGVDVEKLEKNAEKRMNRAGNGLDRPYNQRREKHGQMVSDENTRKRIKESNAGSNIENSIN